MSQQTQQQQPSPRELGAACAAVRAGCACNGLRQAAREITQRYERALAPSGVKATQFPILVALGPGEPIPLTPLADGLAIDRTTLTRNLRILEGRGLVAVAGVREDGRMRMVSITDEGLRVLAHALELWRAAQGDVVDAFGQARLRALLGDLSDLANAGAR
jgi:DNA-binding MarR family transcriptional regulator